MIGLPLSGPPSQPSDVEVGPQDIRQVAGTLRDASAVAIVGATIWLYQRDTDQLAGQTISSATGTWSLGVNYTPSGYYIVYYLAGLAVSTGIMVGPYFTS